jgi:hypothetical protein
VYNNISEEIKEPEMSTLTVAEVTEQVMDEIKDCTMSELRKILFDMGIDARNWSRPEMVQEIVDLEVHAYVH